MFRNSPAKYYQNNRESLPRKARERRFQSLSKEEKEKK